MSEINTKLAEEIKDIILDETGMSPDEVTPESTLLTSGLVDSFTFVTVLTLIETEYCVKIPQHEVTMENFDTIQSIVALVKKYTIS